jgi:hypothetical protein
MESSFLPRVCCEPHAVRVYGRGCKPHMEWMVATSHVRYVRAKLLAREYGVCCDINVCVGSAMSHVHVFGVCAVSQM